MAQTQPLAPQFSPIEQNSLFTGAIYLLRGLKMLLRPELRLYILVPIVVNIILFAILTTLLFGYLDQWFTWEAPTEGTWRFLSKLQGTLEVILGFILATVLIIAYGYSFNVITNLIAAPFYGLLAERTEALLTGDEPEPESILKMIPRTLLRECQKLLYFIIRTPIIFLLGLLLSVTGFLAFCAPLLAILWGAWSMAIQYGDYPADNNKLSFRRLRKRLRKQKYSSIGFGGSVMLGTMIPFVNIFIIPAAVIGGTIYWVTELKYLESQQG